MANTVDARPTPDTPIKLNQPHDHKDLVTCTGWNTYGERFATGTVDGKINVFSRHKDGLVRRTDKWGAHGGEVVELLWLPAQVFPKMIASLGIEGRFKLWAEDPSAVPGRRFHNGGSRIAEGKPAFETRSASANRPYRSFDLRYAEESRVTNLAFLSADGCLSVYESDEPENLVEGACIDEFYVLPRDRRPHRGEEATFRVRFDPNPEPCYTSLRSGLAHDSLSLAVSSVNSVRIFRTRDVVTQAYGVSSTQRQFYCAVEIDTSHGGLIRDIAWAPGNIRGQDLLATACADGIVRVFSFKTLLPEKNAKGWSNTELGKKATSAPGRRTPGTSTPTSAPRSASNLLAAQSGLGASLAKTGPSHRDKCIAQPGVPLQPGVIAHEWRQVARLDVHGAPVWKTMWDFDGRTLGSCGDSGRLYCFRETPDGLWKQSSEVGMMRDVVGISGAGSRIAANNV